MGRLKIINRGEQWQMPDTRPGVIPNPLERYKAVTRDLTDKALEIVNRISIQEMSQRKPRLELLEEYYLLHHYLDFLKRFASSKK